jgi:hypothetical protein
MDNKQELRQCLEYIRNWLECIKNSDDIAKSYWKDKEEALRSKLGLDSNGELKLISSINMTHPSLEEDLDETNFRDTHPWEILDNKTSKDCHRHRIIETNFSPIDIHDETPMELEKGDYIIDEHGSYFMNTSSNPCSYEKSPKLTSLSNIATHEISNPSCFLFTKILK